MPQSKARKHIQTARKELYKETILDAAEAQFAELGYDATKVQVIAASAGVSLATLYSVFDTKSALLCELHERRLTALMTQVMAHVQESDDAFSQLRSGIKTYLSFHIAHPNYLKMHLLEGTAWAVDDEQRTPVQTRVWKAGLEMLVAACREGSARGMLIDEDPELMARTAVAMHQVRLSLWVSRGMVEGAEEVAQSSERLFIRMFCSPEQRDKLLDE